MFSKICETFPLELDGNDGRGTEAQAHPRHATSG